MNAANATVLAVRPIPVGGALDSWRVGLAGNLETRAAFSAIAFAETILRTDAGRIVVMVQPAPTAPRPGERVFVADTGGL